MYLRGFHGDFMIITKAAHTAIVISKAQPYGLSWTDVVI